MTTSNEHIALTEHYAAHNYSPLDVVISSGQGAWVTDVEGTRYLDMLSAYSALNFGHSNARILKAAHAQLDRLTLTSRAFYNDQFGPFCRDLCELSSSEMALIMNSGAEAVETAIKAARRWGETVKGVPANGGEIVTFTNNFAGRTTTIISFSSDPSAREGFGPFTPGFKSVPFGDLEALAAAITNHTIAVLFEPIQGEGGVIIPPVGFLREIRALCTANNVLMIADEVQTGLCRTGRVFACQHEQVQPDLMTVGKSLGGGIIPVSALLGRREVLSLFNPGSHGSTFGGNPLACAIGREVIALIRDERPHERAAQLEPIVLERLRAIKSPKITAVRGRGLMFGIDIDPNHAPAKKVCLKLKDLGVLAKDTRRQTIRLAPPLNIDEKDLFWGIEQLGKALH